VLCCLQAAFESLGMNLSSFGIDANICNGAGSTVSGTYLQASSQFPSKGPCYPVFAATVPYFNRCAPQHRTQTAALAVCLVEQDQQARTCVQAGRQMPLSRLCADLSWCLP
jgi:hypothetical protein